MRVEEPGGPDAVTVNPDRPVYQVNLFKRSEAADTPEELRGYHVSEWKLHDADVTEVLAWAKEKAGSDPYLVSVASALDNGESHLLRLYGQDPNRGEPAEGYYTSPPDGIVPDMEWFIQQAQKDQ
jgi:hypothetical protein